MKHVHLVYPTKVKRGIRFFKKGSHFAKNTLELYNDLGPSLETNKKIPILVGTVYFLNLADYKSLQLLKYLHFMRLSLDEDFQEILFETFIILW